ncbi:GroES-like protein [Coniophora puteana RWD-64-598 SS2]|uniref:GroES-like protein n=1 Tax=Coniophora puteana (strain RWD-64-598) TaxID=741705 RepID=A0A5M3MDF1_CONPW|nr:GroES-like protein [Coniophora puteana RWD-64-598 SS2]EIW77282.1 GroES-like protein [Coniophora puteana RWD-64-598 SS2]
MSPPIPSNMRAIVVEKYGSPDDAFVIKSVPTPVVEPGRVLIRVRAFGVNHAEMHMRRGEWAEDMPIIGIECVGTVVASPDGKFATGTPVATFMGGLGRTINGSYAQYTSARVNNVVALDPDAVDRLGWANVAAIPETYATAWSCVAQNLEVSKGDRLLIRGATSALGKAALKLAIQAGAEVTATTRKEERFGELENIGAKEVLQESPGLAEKVAGRKWDKVLELVGSSTVVSSLKLVKKGGRLCLAGWLGGLEPIKEFNPLLQMPSSVHFSLFGSFVLGEEDFPVSDIPLGDILRMISDGKFEAKPARVFKFEEIAEAHKVMEANEANGKMVVLVE